MIEVQNPGGEGFVPWGVGTVQYSTLVWVFFGKYMYVIMESPVLWIWNRMNEIMIIHSPVIPCYFLVVIV